MMQVKTGWLLRVGLKCFLDESQSAYLSIGVIHALQNPSETEVLEIIEVQSGL